MASGARADGTRQAVTIHYAENWPAAVNSLKGHIIKLVIAVGDAYGLALGASVLRLLKPAKSMVGRYEELFGFVTV